MSLKSPQTNLGGRNSEGATGALNAQVPPATIPPPAADEEEGVENKRGSAFDPDPRGGANSINPRSRAAQITAGARAQVITHLFNPIR